VAQPPQRSSPDIATRPDEIKGKFLRMPGGTTLRVTGNMRWIWNATLGRSRTVLDVFGTWGYENTDGIG